MAPPKTPEAAAPSAAAEATLQQILDDPFFTAKPEPLNNGVPAVFMAVWASLCAVSLGGGAVIGYRSFEGSAAHEALDKFDKKPTVAAEQLAGKLAVRALGWGTAAVVAAAAGAYATGRYALGLQSAADVTALAKATLQPFDSWVRAQSDWLQDLGESGGRQLEGLCDGAAGWWRASWLGGVAKRRIEGGGGADGAGDGRASDAEGRPAPP